MAMQLRNKIRVTAFDPSRSQAVISEVFSKLQLSETNSGVFSGKWGGKGPVAESIDPSTNLVIGRVRTVPPGQPPCSSQL